jgi:AcrR family transcriptional regulator
MSPRKARTAVAADVEASDEDDAEIPEWQTKSVDRSLTAARMRAQERSDRFVEAATELLEEGGNTDFTVQDVVDRSRMSIRTFYNFFASKDDLLVAVHERILAREVVPRLRRRCAKETEPLARIRAYIQGLYDLTSRPGPVYRTLTAHHNRLAETRPDDLERAFRPQLDLIRELILEASEAGLLRSDLTNEKMVRLLHHTVLAAVHARVLAAGGAFEVAPDDLWRFCASGMGIDPADA